jgi:hypothetical protein
MDLDMHQAIAITRGRRTGSAVQHFSGMADMPRMGCVGGPDR